MVFGNLTGEIFGHVQVFLGDHIAQPYPIAILEVIRQIALAVFVGIRLEYNEPSYCCKYQSVSSMALWQPTA